MACLIESDEIDLSKLCKIIGNENLNNCTWYIIEIRIVDYFWTVKHRYSEFFELHEKLVKEYNIDKRWLPPKKFVGNQSESFILKRQHDLEKYLSAVVCRFGARLPLELTAFLQFDLYEIHSLTNTLAKELFLRGEEILRSSQKFCMTPLEIYSTNQRLMLPEPTCNASDSRQDVGHIVDFVSHLQHLKIIGHDRAIGNSNIVVNMLPTDLHLMKSLTTLELCNCNLSNICGLDQVRRTLKSVAVHRCAKNLKDIALIDVSFGQWTGIANESILVPVWSNVTSADFSYNEISIIDESIKLLPRLETLNLSHNRLTDLRNLQHLIRLVVLEAAGNSFTVLENLHTKLGNVKVLNLADNKICSLSGFEKLYSLECLDLTNNEVSQILDIQHLSSLPCLESLVLSNNPITQIVDYRTRILEQFGERAEEIILDWIVSSEKELDTARVLWSIRRAREKQRLAEEENRVSRSLPMANNISSFVEGSKESTSQPSSDFASSNTANKTSRAGVSNNLEQFCVDVERLRFDKGEVWLTSCEKPHCQSNRFDVFTTDQENQAVIANEESSKHQICSTEMEKKDTDYNQLEEENAIANDILSPPKFYRGDIQEEFVFRDAKFLLPENLPNKSDLNFMTYLQALVPDLVIGPGGVNSPRHEDHVEERPIFVMWCDAISWYNVQREFSACVIITTLKIYVFEVVSYLGSSDQIDLSLSDCSKLSNLKSLMMGIDNLFIQIDYMNSEDNARVVLFTGILSKTEEFISHLKMAYKRSIDDLDLYEDPHIVSSSNSLIRLKTLLKRHENGRDDDEIDILFYTLIQCVPADKSLPLRIRSLAITMYYIYILCENFVYVPDENLQFVIEYAFPICSKISSVQMYDSDLDSSIGLPNSKMLSMLTNFIGYGLRLLFDFNSDGSHLLDFRVSTLAQRDKFLTTFTQARQTFNEKLGKRSFRSKPTLADSKFLKNKSMKGLAEIKTKTDYLHLNTCSVVQVVVDASSSSSDIQLNSPCSSDEQKLPKNFTNSRPNQISLVNKTLAATNCASSRESLESQSAGLLIHDSSVLHGNRPMTSLFSSYPTCRLITHLTLCNEQGTLLESLSPALRCLACYSGEELVSFFHSSVTAPGCNDCLKDGENEELCHIMWSVIVLPDIPYSEFVACIMLGTEALYIVSDIVVEVINIVPRTRMHRRNKSDCSAASVESNDSTSIASSTSGRLVDVQHTQVAKVFKTILYSSLKEVHIGLFDQSIRLVFNGLAEAICFLSKNASLTEDFLKHLTTSLSRLRPLPSPECVVDDDDDFYSTFLRRRQPNVTEYIHPSKVKFIYPNDDLLSELTSFIKNYFRANTFQNSEKVSILQYVLVNRMDFSKEITDSKQNLNNKCTSRSLVVTESHLILLLEDYVNYPLLPAGAPLPSQPRYELDQLRPLLDLRRIVLSDFTSHDITFVFVKHSSEANNSELAVDENFDYFGSYNKKSDLSVNKATKDLFNSGTKKSSICSDESLTAHDSSIASEGHSVQQKHLKNGTEKHLSDIEWTIWLQNLEDKERLIKLVNRQWEEVIPGRKLSIEVSS